jgi:hypothetical protein
MIKIFFLKNVIKYLISIEHYRTSFKRVLISKHAQVVNVKGNFSSEAASTQVATR